MIFTPWGYPKFVGPYHHGSIKADLFVTTYLLVAALFIFFGGGCQ